MDLKTMPSGELLDLERTLEREIKERQLLLDPVKQEYSRRVNLAPKIVRNCPPRSKP